MSFSVKTIPIESSNTCEISIGGEITIYEALDFYESLRDLEISADNTLLDLCNLTSVDSSGAQILFAFMRLLNTQGHSTKIANANEQIHEKLTTLGIKNSF